MTEPQLVAVYNRVLKSGGLPARICSARVVRQAGEFLFWCDRNGVDPERYIRARHDSIGFKNRIPINRLASYRFLEKFRQFGDAKQAHEVAQDNLAVTVVPDRAAESFAEALRASHGQYRHMAEFRESCLIDVSTWYNEQSVWCLSCDLNVECRRRARSE